ncbi:DUF1289 domain-containing protein [uncultured Parasphingorhabdus sp.]|uniref:DUF1289 domain-containing protein n=1 Tax=uncultured Parasphingorhabdus sp. TaxID=2709694 RepID=UPI0030DA11B7
MKSPCNDICTIDRPSGLCVGCGRSLSEIAEWGSASPSRKREIFSLLPERMQALDEKRKGRHEGD